MEGRHLFSGDVTAKEFGFEPVDDDKDAVSCYRLKMLDQISLL